MSSDPPLQRRQEAHAGPVDQRADGALAAARAGGDLPVGPKFVGWGMWPGAGSSGELLLDPAAVFVLSPWNGVSPSEFSITVPNDCALVGVHAYFQGVIGDRGLATAGLTEGADLTAGTR